MQTLEESATGSNSDLSSAFSALSTEFGGQISTGSPASKPASRTRSTAGGTAATTATSSGCSADPCQALTASRPAARWQEISTALEQGDLLNAFSYFDTCFLESVDHTLKPLLSPLLDETSKGATTLSIPVELSQIQTNLLETFGNYNELKAFGDATLSPAARASLSACPRICRASRPTSPPGTTPRR